VDKTKANSHRFAAAKCRKAASTSTNPKEWIALAEQWESLADAQQLLPSESRNKGKPSSDRTNGSSAPGFHDLLDWVP
jgi:hypothetical protein